MKNDYHVNRPSAHGSRRFLGTRVVLLAFLCVSLVHSQATRKLHGSVEKLDDKQGVPFADFGIRNINSGQTNSNGEYSIPVLAKMQPGFILDFYVTGWIIYSPNNDGVNGRVPFIDFDTYRYRLIVVKPGDKMLLSDTGIQNLLLGATADFRRLSASYVSATRPRIAPEAVSLRQELTVSPVSREEPRSALFSRWLMERSKYVGFSFEELTDAVGRWAAQVKSSFDQGLVGLYQGNTESAISLFRKAESDPQARPTSLKATAFAYGMQHDWAKAAIYLQTAIKEGTQKDPHLYNNLATVFEFDGKLDQARRAREKANKLVRENVGDRQKVNNPSPDRIVEGGLVPTPAAPDLKTMPTSPIPAQLVGQWEAAFRGRTVR